MPKIENVDAVIKRLQALKKEAKEASNISVQVGYTQSYAVWVHENLEASHAEGKSAKFLSIPAKEHQHTLSKIVTKIYKKTKDMKLALTTAGMRLLRESQKIVPIRTGALKASGYVSTEEEAEVNAKKAWEKGERVRKGPKRDPKTGRYLKKRRP